MHQKQLVRDAWRSAGLYDDGDERLRQFLDRLDEPHMCWPEMTRLLRRSFAEYKARVVAPLLAQGDTLTRLVVLRALADADDDEARLVERFVSASDAARDEVELLAIAERAAPRFDKALRRKRSLTAPVLGVLARRPPLPARRSRAKAARAGAALPAD